MAKRTAAARDAAQRASNKLLYEAAVMLSSMQVKMGGACVFTAVASSQPGDMISDMAVVDPEPKRAHLPLTFSRPRERAWVNFGLIGQIEYNPKTKGRMYEINEDALERALALPHTDRRLAQ